MGPALRISNHLISHGFEVTIPADPAWSQSITDIGAHVCPVVVCILSIAQSITNSKGSWLTSAGYVGML